MCASRSTVSEEEVEAVIREISSESQEQIPPMYSALKVDGKEAVRARTRRQDRGA